MTSERYLGDQLVSQVCEYAYGKLIAAVFN